VVAVSFDLAGDVSKAAPGAVYGAALLLCVYSMPLGVAGLVRRIVKAAARQRASE
jgi:hypothetical protein